MIENYTEYDESRNFKRWKFGHEGGAYAGMTEIAGACDTRPPCAFHLRSHGRRVSVCEAIVSFRGSIND